jgi:hypothetical protein
MARSLNPNRTDVLESPGAVHGVVTVSTTASEIKVGVNRLANRQAVFIYNDGSQTIYYASISGVTAAGATKGLPLYKDQFVILPIGDQPWYFIAAVSNPNVIVSEVP